MACFEALGCFMRNLGFTVPLFGKYNSKRVQIALETAAKRNQACRVQSTGKENSQRNIRDQVVANGFLEQWAQPFRGFLKSLRRRPFLLEHGIGINPIGLRRRFCRRSFGGKRKAMPWRNRENAIHQRGRFDYRTERQESFQGIRRQARLEPAAGPPGTHFGRKQESATRDRVIQRLDSQPVPRQKNLRAPRRFSRGPGGTRIPDGDGEHPAEFAQTLFAPLLISVDDDLRIRVSPEGMPAPFERLAQLREVVNFTVKNNRDIARFVEYGLVSTRQVNDAEAAHPERRRRRHQDPILIRAAML